VPVTGGGLHVACLGVRGTVLEVTAPLVSSAPVAPAGAATAAAQTATDPVPVQVPEPVFSAGLWVVGDPEVLSLPAVGLVGSRADTGFTTRVAQVAAAAAAAAASPSPVALWVRLSPSGAERRALDAALVEGVPVVALCSVGPLAPPVGLVSAVVSSGGALCSVLSGDAEASEVSVQARDLLLARVPAALVAVDGTAATAPDSSAIVGDAALFGRPLVVARPRTGHRRGADAQMSQALSGASRMSKLGWTAAQVHAVAGRDTPAHAVCESPDEVAAAVDLLVRFADPTPPPLSVLPDEVVAVLAEEFPDADGPADEPVSGSGAEVLHLL
jgi:hypothetical protein